MARKILSVFPNVDLILNSNYGKFLCEIEKDFTTDKFNLTEIPQEFYFEKVNKILLLINRLQKKKKKDLNQVDDYDFNDLPHTLRSWAHFAT